MSEYKLNKYIIKNCPALSYGKIKFKKCYRVNWKQDCKDISDCLLKQIVERASKFRSAYADEILDLLEIEEVDEESESEEE